MLLLTTAFLGIHNFGIAFWVPVLDLAILFQILNAEIPGFTPKWLQLGLVGAVVVIGLYPGIMRNTSFFELDGQSSFESFIVMCISLYALVMMTNKVLRNPSVSLATFWICCAVLCFSIPDVIVRTTIVLFVRGNDQIQNLVWSLVHPISTMICNFMFTKAILCLPSSDSSWFSRS
ncbi:MAG: hypothetical protein U0T84_00660 [Chitinophagales bacterium]